MTASNPNLSAPHWAPFRNLDLANVPHKLLKRLDRFLVWLHETGRAEVDRNVLLAYAQDAGTLSILRRLIEAFEPLLAADHPLRRELREAMLDHERRGRGDPMRVEILEAPWWRPLVGRANTDAVAYERLKFVDRWFAHLHRQGITQPMEADYLAYVSEAASPEPLRDLQEALLLLELPAVPSVAIELPNAITTKRIQCSKAPRGKTRKAPERHMSVAPDALPPDWQESLAAMRRGERRNRVKAPAPSIVDGIETALCQHAHHCLAEARPIELSIASIGAYVRHLETSKTRKGKNRRPATLEMRVSALGRFARYAGAPTDIVAALRMAEARRQADSGKVVALKYAKMAEIGSVHTVLEKAVDLLGESRTQKTLNRRMTRLNHASSLALFVLLPVRLSDTCLCWGRDIGWCEAGYTIDIDTKKTGEPVSGPLPAFLTPFVDALLLRGLDEAYLPAIRQAAIREQRPLLANRNEQAAFGSYVSHAWRTHFGTGQHISRALVHTDLGRLGPKGVAEALALCAQRDPRTAKLYQGKAMADALLIRGLQSLADEFTDEEMAQHFPNLDGQHDVVATGAE